MEQWVVEAKRADFKAIGEKYGIDQVTARIIRNRDITRDADIDLFLNGGVSELYDPHLLKDADRLADILLDKIGQNAHIRIIGDYDIDGVMSTYILRTAFVRCGARASTQIPDRVRDGYGLNLHLIEAAHRDGVDTVVTCDNGIAAIEEIAYAKSLGMTVLVTDHHEIPFRERDGQREHLSSAADAIVNPHQKDCPYPNKDLCGAAVAWKLVCILYERLGIPKEEALDFLENVAFATVGDIMNLIGENRILVKEGIRRIHRTKNPGMRALIAQCGLEPGQIDAYHFGFVLGPCINASGRLDTAKRALELFFQTSETEAARIANELVVLNQERKALTEAGVEQAVRAYEEECSSDPVAVIYLPGVHESIAGIIAGRIREKYYKPTFILTDTEDGVKGSGRSVEEYSMYEELCGCQELFTKFGGHPMAAGLSLPRENVQPFREKINARCPKQCRDLVPKIRIDVPMPVDYVSMELVRQFGLLAPFGKGNPKPVFADRNLRVLRMWTVGKNQNVLRLSLRAASGKPVSAVYFGDIEKFQSYLLEKFGEAQLRAALLGRENRIVISAVYAPKINRYRDSESLQFEIQSYR